MSPEIFLLIPLRSAILHMLLEAMPTSLRDIEPIWDIALFFQPTGLINPMLKRKK